MLLPARELELVRRIVALVLFGGLIYSSALVVGKLKDYPLPGNQQGYEPEQPIAFSHQLHAGEMQISCLYCHFGAETSPHAGIPPASVCMNCHRFVTAPQKDVLQEILEARKAKRTPEPVVSPELQKLYDALALDDKLQPDPKKSPSRSPGSRSTTSPLLPVSITGRTCMPVWPASTATGPWRPWNASGRWPTCRWVGASIATGRAADRRGRQEVQPSTDCAACHY